LIKYQEKMIYIRFGHFKNDFNSPLYEMEFTKNVIDRKDNKTWFL